MIGYTTLGTNDLEKAAAFYDDLLAVLGAKRMWDMERIKIWGTNGAGMVAVCKPHDGKAATAGNGTMVALMAPDTGTVDKLHAKALDLGGVSEGEPGERGPGMYFAYFRDLDGNKFAAFHMAQQPSA